MISKSQKTLFVTLNTFFFYISWVLLKSTFHFNNHNLNGIGIVSLSWISYYNHISYVKYNH